MLPSISLQGVPSTVISTLGHAENLQSSNAPKHGTSAYSDSMTFQTIKSYLQRLNVPKTRDLSDQPERIHQAFQRLNSAPDRALLFRQVSDHYCYSSQLSAMFIEAPYDQAVQPSLFGLCLNAFYLKQKLGIDVYVPSFYTFKTGEKRELDACVKTVAQHLLEGFKDKTPVAVIMPAENALDTGYAHVSTLILQREHEVISCIVYDGIMSVPKPVVDLFEVIAQHDTIKKLDIFIPNGISQADNLSCRTKSLVEASVALRYPNPFENVGSLESFPDVWKNTNTTLVELENNNSKVAVQCFQRNMYPDKTAQLSRYHSQHSKVVDHPIGFNAYKSLHQHIQQHTRQVFLSTKPIENGISLWPGGISFEKPINVYLKLKGIQVASRAQAIVEAIKREYGDQYKDVLNAIIDHHSLQTAGAESWTQAENKLK